MMTIIQLMSKKNSSVLCAITSQKNIYYVVVTHYAVFLMNTLFVLINISALNSQWMSSRRVSTNLDLGQSIPIYCQSFSSNRQGVLRYDELMQYYFQISFQLVWNFLKTIHLKCERSSRIFKFIPIGPKVHHRDYKIVQMPWIISRILLSPLDSFLNLHKRYILALKVDVLNTSTLRLLLYSNSCGIYTGSSL